MDITDTNDMADEPINDADSVRISSDEELLATSLSLKGEEVLRNSLNVIRVSNINGYCYSYKGRVKDPVSIKSKVLRRRFEILDSIQQEKKEKDRSYRVSNVTDVVGIRIITLFNSEILSAVNDILNLITGQTDLNPNELLDCKIKEFLLITTQASIGLASPVQTMQRRFARRLVEVGISDVDVTIETRREYSSVHIVIEKNIDELAVPIEIQIRTVFEDTWAQIDHKLRYHKSRIKNESTQKNVPVAAERDLVILKKYIDITAEFAEAIKDELEETEDASRGQIRPIGDDFTILEAARSLEIKDDIIQEIEVLFRQKDVLDQRFADYYRDERVDSYSSKKEKEFSEAYAILAEKLSKISEREKSGLFINSDLNEEQKKFLFYVIKMEEAFCRLKVGHNDERLAAIKIYDQISVLHHDVAVVHFRKGESLSKSGRHEDAIASFEKCLNNLDTKNEYFWLNYEKQRNYIKENIHRIKGFAHWKIFEKENIRGNQECIEHIRLAWESTYKGLDYLSENDVEGRDAEYLDKIDRLRSRLVNNLLSYYFDIKTVEKRYNIRVDAQNFED
ncbi:hypothetical protein, partial [Ekhidna sp.]